MNLPSPPFFSIILPVKGRATLARDALVSILKQDVSSIEVIVSNNGAEAAVRDALAGLINDPRIRYVEQTPALDMPTHWEHLARMATGQYLLVVPDRSLLCKGALAKVRALHEENPSAAEILSWTWSLYHDGPGLLQRLPGDGALHVLGSDHTMIASVSSGGSLPYALPRGLNSSVSMALVKEIRAREGSAFPRINPDFTFAFHCLLRRPAFAHLASPLMVSQGLSLSNGGNALQRDARGYLASIGMPDAPILTPVHGALVENLILEDFLAACAAHGRNDLLARWDRTAYFIRCLAEIEIKRAGGVADPSYVDWIASDIKRALASEPREVRDGVAASTENPGSRLRRLRFRLKRIIGERLVGAIRSLRLQAAGARRYASALEAAGFQ